MTIFICISENMREMFHLKQNSSRFSIADVCFLRAEVIQRMHDFSEQTFACVGSTTIFGHGGIAD